MTAVTWIDVLLVLVGVWIAELLVALVLLAWALVESFRRGPQPEPAQVPDTVPEDFGPVRFVERRG